MTLIRIIERGSIEAAVFQVRHGYRATIRSPGFHWHPGIFPEFDRLWDWLQFQVATVETGLPLSPDWLPLDGDRRGNGFYRDWFIYRPQAQLWQGYDPSTNCCLARRSRLQLQAEIDSLEDRRQQPNPSPTPQKEPPSGDGG